MPSTFTEHYWACDHQDRLAVASALGELPPSVGAGGRQNNIIIIIGPGFTGSTKEIKWSQTGREEER